jgi:hypothetical protein
MRAGAGNAAKRTWTTGFPQVPKPRVEGGALRRYPACGSTGERVSGGKTPYSDLPPQAFWRTGVAEPGLAGLRALWSSRWALPADARFATFGSCFAQHIGRALTARGQHWLDAEPAPGRTPPEIARAFNYGVFSARTGNIYTAAQLLLLVRLAAGEDDPDLNSGPMAPGWRIRSARRSSPRASPRPRRRGSAACRWSGRSGGRSPGRMSSSSPWA